MPDDTRDETEVRIRPSIRRIGALPRRTRGVALTRLGVLRPFSGLLGAGRRGSPERPRVNLSYLTLEPLVVARLAGDDGPAAGRVDAGRTGTNSDRSGAEANGRRGGDERDRLTVREYLERSRDATRESGVGTDQRTPERSTSPDSVNGSGDGGGESGRRGELPSVDPVPSPGDTTRRRESLAVVERWHRPPSAADRGRRRQEREEGDRPVASDRPAERPAGPSGTPPGRTGARRSPPVRGDERPEGERESASPGDPPGEPGGSSTTPGSGTERSRPRLVVREAGPDERYGPVGGEVEPSDDRKTAAGHDGRTSPAPRFESRATGADEDTERHAGSDDTGSPLAFESFADPAFDRFVERLSRELDRRERIERERRGL